MAADKYNIGTGVWVSPWGGYGEAKETRIKFGKKDGYELSEMETGVGFSLSGPKYFKRFSEIMLNMVTRCVLVVWTSPARTRTLGLCSLPARHTAPALCWQRGGWCRRARRHLAFCFGARFD